MRAQGSELWFGRGLLLVLMALTIIPFISLFTTALHPSGSIPLGIEWPADPAAGGTSSRPSTRPAWARCLFRA